MNWPELRRRGYELAVGKQSWSLWFKKDYARRLVTSGSKRPATPRVTIEKRAYPYAIADFVKQRVSLEERPNINLDKVKDKVQRQLGQWMANRLDEAAYAILKEKYLR